MIFPLNFLFTKEVFPISLTESIPLFLSPIGLLQAKKRRIEKIKKLYLSKKKSRIDIIGSKENDDLEKKIFLQVIDFTWRSHLQ